MTNPSSQTTHDTMVQVKSILLKFDKFNDIRANIPSNPDKPAAISLCDSTTDYIPDITAVRDKLTFFEVETADSLQTEAAQTRWRQLSGYCKENDVVFRIVVPKGQASETQTIIDKLQIDANIDEMIDAS
jgi:hypothetical protein